MPSYSHVKLKQVVDVVDGRMGPLVRRRSMHGLELLPFKFNLYCASTSTACLQHRMPLFEGNQLSHTTGE